MAIEPTALRIMVCYPTPSSTWLRELTLPVGATVGEALRASGFDAAFPGLDAWSQGVGVFGKQCAVRQPGGMEAVNLKVAERYVDAFSNVAKEGNTLILPSNLSDVGGLIASAMAIVKTSKPA